MIGGTKVEGTNLWLWEQNYDKNNKKEDDDQISRCEI
jgi:hypothetical protein